MRFHFLKKNFAGINFRSSDKCKHLTGKNFRDFVRKPRKPRKLVPAKISTIKVYNYICLLQSLLLLALKSKAV